MMQRIKAGFDEVSKQFVGGERPVMRLASYARRLRNIWVHPGNRNGRTAALMRALAWRSHLAVRKQGPWFPLFNGLKFRTADNSMSRSIVYCSPWFEYDEMMFVASYLRRGDAVLDVGANAGVYSLLAASLVGPEGHVDAVEPIAETARRLRENIQENQLADRIQVHAVAVGEAAGVVHMIASQDTTNHVVGADAGSPVSCVRLDSLMGSRAYAFGKMDVEGMELPALKGASARLDTGDPAIWMIEVNGALFRYGFTVAELIEWVDSKGYDVATYNHARRTMTVTKAPWGNVFLVKRDAWNAIKARVPELNTIVAADPGSS